MGGKNSKEGTANQGVEEITNIEISGSTTIFLIIFVVIMLLLGVLLRLCKVFRKRPKSLNSNVPLFLERQPNQMLPITHVPPQLYPLIQYPQMHRQSPLLHATIEELGPMETHQVYPSRLYNHSRPQHFPMVDPSPVHSRTFPSKAQILSSELEETARELQDRALAADPHPVQKL